MGTKLSIEDLWQQAGFAPNTQQRNAILHVDGPLYLPAGPGSGKTRVLLWRALNLIVFHGVAPERVFLSTFTEKAAFQLREGLRALLGSVTTLTGHPYDLSRMYVGTVHSLCQRILRDRRFYPDHQIGRTPTLLDELSQFFYIHNRRLWEHLLDGSNFGVDPALTLNSLFDANTQSRYTAVTNCTAFFNRLSEEVLLPEDAARRAADPVFCDALRMYGRYLEALRQPDALRTDLSLVQQDALTVLQKYTGPAVFRYVIIDEYQDTNTVQERLFFSLAKEHGNLCIVGDDDQALYRFRGATVENFVEFPNRCLKHLGTSPRKIPLSINYRSRKQIVDCYTSFISSCDWRKVDNPDQHYRVMDKDIRAHSQDTAPAVVANQPADPASACAEIAGFVKQLLDEKKVQDPNQIAFLFPSLKSVQVTRMKEALEKVGLLVYAPRAGSFLDVDEAVATFGVFLHILGRPERGNFSGVDYNNYYNWIDRAHAKGSELLDADAQLRSFVSDRRTETQDAVSDHNTLERVVAAAGWDPDKPYEADTMRQPLAEAPGLSARARKSLMSIHFSAIVEKRQQEGNPFPLRTILRRATALDWSVLDLFYQLCGFGYFKAMLDKAEGGGDEGPTANLSLVSQYLGRFNDQFLAIVTGDLIQDGWFQRVFFGSYLYALFRRGESEFEDADDPFPKGRIPFLTIHQAKGLQFPVVVLGNPRRNNHRPSAIERLVRPLLDREGEPLDRMSEFDTMRMFYVALSRPQNLLLIAHYRGRGISTHKAISPLLDQATRLSAFDMGQLPAAQAVDDDLPGNYSFTGDYLLFNKCPRQYMVFRKFGFVPSRSQTMMFGSLVHRTLDDLHNYLIAQRNK